MPESIAADRVELLARVSVGIAEPIVELAIEVLL